MDASLSPAATGGRHFSCARPELSRRRQTHRHRPAGRPGAAHAGELPACPSCASRARWRLIASSSGTLKAEAALYRQLWTERDGRVPPHRPIDVEGRPTVEHIAAQIGSEAEGSGTGLLAVERKSAGDVIGYCGVTSPGNGSLEEPELGYELLRAAQGSGYATEAGRAVVTWAAEAGYRRLWAGVWDWNVASRRVLEKLGFRTVAAPSPASSTDTPC